MITRRKLLVLLGSYMLAACSPLAYPTPQPTQIPTETKLPPTQQPTATPTVTPSPTLTMTPTPLPTQTPTVTPDRVSQTPKIEGLIAKAADGKIVYLAEASNPYGLEKEAVAGVYYPEAYSVSDSEETAKRVGAVGIRKEVERYYLQQAGSPENAILWALPFDITPAGDEKLLVQQVKNTYDVQNEIFISVPENSVLVNPLEVNGDSLDVSFTQQSWGTVINIGYPGVFSDTRYPENKFSLKICFAGYLENKQVTASLGQELTEINKVVFSSDQIAFYNKYRQPFVVSGTNVQFYGQSYFEVDGKAPTIGMSLENILHFGNSFAYILGNENPLLK